MIETASRSSFCSVSMTSENVLEEGAQDLEFLHGADQFLEVFQPARRVGRAVVLPHGGVAALVEDLLGEFVRGSSRRSCQRAKFSTTSRSAARGFGFISSVWTISRAAASIGMSRARA
jgi:hypothetical protein